jgi:hypothetical protein
VKLELKTESQRADCTIGSIYVDGVWTCFSLEDAVRHEKIPGKTAIPAGTYAVVINYSSRFKREMPQILNVPGYEGIRLHPGNTAADTEGCILVGQMKGVNSVLKSRAAFADLFPKLQACKDPMSITITRLPENQE